MFDDIKDLLIFNVIMVLWLFYFLKKSPYLLDAYRSIYGQNDIKIWYLPQNNIGRKWDRGNRLVM